MHPSVVIASYGYYLLALYTASLMNPATYLTLPMTYRGRQPLHKA